MRFFIWVFRFYITVMFFVALWIVFLDNSLELVLYYIPAGRQPWSAPSFPLAFMFRRMAIKAKTIQFFKMGFPEGVKPCLIEERSHGKVHFSIDDGTGVEDEFIGWMIGLNKKYIKIKEVVVLQQRHIKMLNTAMRKQLCKNMGYLNRLINRPRFEQRRVFL